jgi:hypothetical protein
MWLYGQNGLIEQINNSAVNVPLYDAYKDFEVGNLPSFSLAALNGSIDEIYYWNRTLNETEPNDIWMLSQNITPPAGSPIVEIQRPANTTYSITPDLGAVDILFTSESPTLAECWYSLNGGNNVSLPSCLNATSYPNDLFDQIAASGTYEMKLYANDTSGNIGYAEVNFSTSRVPPSVAVSSPNGYYNTHLTTFFQVPSGYRELCWFEIDNVANYSVGCTNLPFPTLYNPEGNHTFCAWVNNTFGENASSCNNVIVDTTSPAITIISPAGTVSSPFNVSYSAIDINLDSCWYSVDDISNVSIPFCANFTDTASVGSHNITIYANDTLNNIGSATSAFTISAPFVPPHTGMVTGATAGIYMLFPMLLGLLILLLAIYMLMSGHADIKEAAVMIIIGIIMIIAATSIMASFL